jgi:GGDEF domain-containing protein
MSGPFQYQDFNRDLGVESPLARSEWDTMLQRRTQLVNEIENRLRLANEIRARSPVTAMTPGGDLRAADQVANAHQVQGQNEDGSPTQYQYLHQLPTHEDANELLGAAQFWGIPNADRIPPQALKKIIEQKRLSSEDVDRGLNPFVDVGMTAAAAAGLGATQTLIATAQHIPFIGHAIAEMETTQRASQFMHALNEGVQAGMTQDERKGYRIAHGLGGVLGFIVPGEAAWQAAGAVGKLGALGRAGMIGRYVTSPIARAAIQGAASTWMLEGGGDQSNEEAAFKVALGAGIGVAATVALPYVAAKVGSFFRTKSAASLAEDIVGDPWARPEMSDAEWYFEADHQLPGQGQPPRLPPEGGTGNYGGPGGPSLPPGSGGGAPPVDPSIRLGGGMSPGEVQGLPAPEMQLQMDPSRQLMSPQMAAMTERLNAAGASRDEARRLLEVSPLTGQGNKVALQRAMPAVDADPSLKWAVFDGKQFKAVNDTHGHMVGDQTLANFGRTLDQVAAEMGIPARTFHISGDEFAAALPANQADAFVARVRELSYQKISGPKGTTETWLDGHSASNFGEADLEMLANKRKSPDSGLANPLVSANDVQITPGNMPVGETGNGVATAASEAAILTKQATLVEGATVPELAAATSIDETDVVKSALLRNPQRINVVQGVGDASKTIRSLIAAQAEGRVMPHQFRMVERNGGMDMLVSDGLPITNKRVEQYKAHGFFDGQNAIAGGREVVIVNTNAGEGKARVKSPFSDETHLVAHDQILPGRSSEAGMVEGGDKIYGRFQQMVQNYMSSEAAKLPAGAQTDVSWLSRETSSQLPRLMDTFLDAEVGKSPLSRAALESYFNVRRVQDYQSLAPAEIGEAQAINRELDIVRSAMPQPAIPIEDIAGTKGFSYVPDGPTGGGTLVDRLGDLRVPVAHEEAAFEFLRNFNRDLPDYSPISDVPVEVAGSSPHAANPGNDVEPVLERGAEAGYNLTSAGTDRVEAATARATTLPVEPATAASVRARYDPALTQPPGGGTPPPPGGRNLPGGGQNQLPPGPRSLGAQFAEAARSKPRELYAIEQSFDSAWLNYMTPFRSVALQVEHGLKEIGITEGTLWKHYNQVVTNVTRAHNEALPWQAEYADIMSNFRRKILRNGTVTKIQEITDYNAKIGAMQRAGYTAEERAAQNRLGDFNDRFFQYLVNDPAYKLDASRYINGYMSHVRARQGQPGIQDPFKDTKDILPHELKFFAEMAREGNMQFRQMDARTLGTKMIRAAMFKKHVGDAYAEMAQAWDDPRIPDEFRGLVKDWLEVVRTGHNPNYDVAVQGTRHFLNRLGVPITDGEVSTLSNIAFGNMYRAQLGGRPDAIFRDSIQPFFSGVRVGFTPIIKAYNTFLTGGQTTRDMIERGLAGGWLEKGQAKVANADVFEAGIQTPTGTDLLSPEQQVRREFMAKFGDMMWAMTPKSLRNGLQGSRLDPLYYYTKLGEVNRLVSGEAGYQTAATALADYQYEMGRLVRGEVTPEAGKMWADRADEAMAALLKDSKARAYPQPIQDEFKRLVGNGQVQEAAYLLGNESANMQFRYGAKENPIGIRKAGNVGRAAMQFGTFTQQYIAQMREMAAGPGVHPAEKVAMLARYSTVGAALGLAAAYTGWNFSKWAWHQSLTFAGGPLGQGLYGAAQAVTGAAAEAMGAPVTPGQRAALDDYGRTTVGDVAQTVASQFFPYTSTARTAANITNMASGINPVEGTARAIVTGERSLQPDIRQGLESLGERVMDPYAAWRANNPAFRDNPPAVQPGYSPSNMNQDLNAVFGGEIPTSVSTPGTTRMSPNGYQVYDSQNIGPDGRVPTHRLDVPSGKRPDETWEDYEARVHARPIESFGPDAFRQVRDPNTLEPAVRDSLTSMLAAAQREGYPLRINETFRPQERQEFLFKQGRSMEGPIVSWTLTSDHVTNRAADLEPLGKGPAKEAGWRWIQENGPRFGFNVMGSMDPGHVSMPMDQQMQQPGQRNQYTAGSGAY